MVKAVIRSPFPKSTYARNALVYRLLANPKRLEILNLVKYQELTVTQMVETLGVRKANVSQHLGILRRLGLVRVRRNSKNAYYTITNPEIVGPCKILNDLWEHKHLHIPSPLHS